MDSNLGFAIITDNKRTSGRLNEKMHAKHLLQSLKVRSQNLFVIFII